MTQNVKNRLPEFLGIGPPRTGTTWLHNDLSTWKTPRAGRSRQPSPAPDSQRLAVG